MRVEYLQAICKILMDMEIETNLHKTLKKNIL